MVSAFLQDNFNNPDGVMGLLAKHYAGAMPRREAVVKWFQRGSVPGAWVIVLFDVVRRETGKYPDTDKYVGVVEIDIFA